MHPAFHAHPATAIPLVLLAAKGLGPWTREQPDRVKRLVDRMEEEGLVKRISCPEDKRGHLLELTPEGYEMRKRMWTVYAPAMDEAMKRIGGDFRRSNRLLSLIPQSLHMDRRHTCEGARRCLRPRAAAAVCASHGDARSPGAASQRNLHHT